MQRRLPLTALAVMFVLALPGLGKADVVFPPGGRVGLELAGDLKPSKRLPGFADEGRNAVVAILDLPGAAYGELERSLFAQQAALTDLKRESFPFADGIGFLVSGRVEVRGVMLHKWFLLANTVANALDLSALVNVEVPEAARAIYTDAVVRKMLASVTFRPAPLEEQIKMLPFTIGEYAGFRPMKAMPSGGVILIDGPADDINLQPYMILSVESGGPSDAADRVKFAGGLLATAPLRDLQVQSADVIRLGGQQTFEIRAQAVGLMGLPVNLVQWVKFGDGGYLRIIGVAARTDWNALYARFRAVRDGIGSREKQ
jgi:hypothetical protein